MTGIFSRMDREARTIEVMISLFCRNHHGENLCPECSELMKYAMERLQNCPFEDGKTVCVKCPVRCYQPVMREKIRTVMRYAGRRMTFRHPVLAFFHFVDRRRKEPVKPGKS
jgi:hypothetical protein